MDKTVYEIANEYIDKNTELKIKIIDLEDEIRELKRVINLMKFYNKTALNIADENEGKKNNG